MITMGWENGAQFSAHDENAGCLYLANRCVAIFKWGKFISWELSLHFSNMFLAIPTAFFSKTI